MEAINKIFNYLSFKKLVIRGAVICSSFYVGRFFLDVFRDKKPPSSAPTDSAPSSLRHRVRSPVEGDRLRRLPLAVHVNWHENRGEHLPTPVLTKTMPAPKDEEEVKKEIKQNNNNCVQERNPPRTNPGPKRIREG
jgi:hypothetical protein